MASFYADANVTSIPETRWSQFLSGPVGLRVDGNSYIQGICDNYTSANTIGACIAPTRTGLVRANLSCVTPIEVNLS